MSYHIISIDSPQCTITCARGQLVSISAEGTRSIPMEDVAAVVITSFKCSLSSNFLIEAAKHRIGVILCEAYKPVSLLLPVDRATDTQLLRNLAGMSAQMKKRLWEKTVNAKCYNQIAIATQWAPLHPSLLKMNRLLAGSKDSKEGETAKCYWSIFSDTFTAGTFTRTRDGDGVNTLFNYAYAVLLSCVLRNMLALGIDPTFGLFHTSRAHASPLAYDLMEPFRPVFDASIARYISSCRAKGINDEQIAQISNDSKQTILSTLLLEVTHLGKQRPVKALIEEVIRSFRGAILTNRISLYEPWKISTIKWDG